MFCEMCEVLVCLVCIRNLYATQDLVDIEDGYESKKTGRKQQDMETGEINLKTDAEMKAINTNNGFTMLKEDLVKYRDKLKEEIDKLFNELEDQFKEVDLG